MAKPTQYTEENIRSLDWKEHIRMRPGMYIGKLGDGSSPDDGIYILLKEVLDNCIDEFVMGVGKTIEISIKDNVVSVRDYGRGIPLGKSGRCCFQNEHRWEIRFQSISKIRRLEWSRDQGR
jgi:topoisomerase-4 subunit B